MLLAYDSRGARIVALQLHSSSGDAAEGEYGRTKGSCAAWGQRERIAAASEVQEPGRELQAERAPALGHRRRLELGPERSTRAEEQHLDGGDGRVEALRDLVVGEPGDLTEEEDRPLLPRKRDERAPDGVGTLVGRICRRARVEIERLLARAAEGRAEAPPA